MRNLKIIIVMVFLGFFSIAQGSSSDPRPPSNGDTRITTDEYHWLSRQLSRSTIPSHPISCETGKKIKVDDPEIYTNLKNTQLPLAD